MKKLFLFVLILSLPITVFYGSGFQINEHGSKAMSLGGAFAGLANDPSAIYFNPAGITQLTGTHILGGTTLIFPSSTFRGPAPTINETKMETQSFTPIHFDVTHQFSKEFYLGFGIGNNYGLGTKWDENWVGRFVAVETEIRTFFFNLVAAYQINDQISVALGYNYAYGDVTIARKLNLSPFNNEAYLSLEGTGSGSGVTVGLLYKPLKELNLGLSYRSRVKISFDGDATPSEVPTLFEGRIPNGSISAPLTTPDNVTFGLAYTGLTDLTFTADYQFVAWTTYDKLEVKFNDFIDTETNAPLVSSSTRDYENGFIARFGVEYYYDKDLSLRGGLFYDDNPVKDERLDPTLSDADRLGFNLGVGYKLTNNLMLEAAYMFIRFQEREITNSLVNYSGVENSISPMNGVYNSTANLISMTVSYQF